jgi:hypothetical protein
MKEIEKMTQMMIGWGNVRRKDHSSTELSEQIIIDYFPNYIRILLEIEPIYMQIYHYLHFFSHLVH